MDYYEMAKQIMDRVMSTDDEVFLQKMVDIMEENPSVGEPVLTELERKKLNDYIKVTYPDHGK